MIRVKAALLLLLGAVLSTGCGDDPELVGKNEEQKAEIRRLEGELDLLRDKLDRAPEDRSADLAEVRAATKREESEIKRLEQSLGSLLEEKRKVEGGLKKYRREYPIR